MLTCPSIYQPVRNCLLILLFSSVFGTLSAYSQVNVSGPTCVNGNVQYSYNLSAYYSGTATFSYSVSNGTLSTGGSSGNSSGPGSITILVTWSGSGYILLTSPAGSKSLSVTVAPTFTTGTITSGQTQNINYNTVPATINCSAATGGSCTTTNFVYQWQSSPDNVNYINMNGVTSQNLAFSSGATQTAYYRRFVTETVSNNTGYSPVASVILNPPNPVNPVGGGNVTPSQSINYNTAPTTLSSTGVSGGTYSYTYQWQQSTDNATWTNIPCAATAYSPAVLSVTTYFRVAVTSNSTTAYSTPATITVYPKLVAGAIAPTSVIISSGSSPGNMTSNKATGGNGTYAYQWQNSTDGVNFTNIGGATALYYVSGTLTANSWYRLSVTSNGVTAYSYSCAVTISSAVPDINFVRVREIHKPGIIDSASASALTSPYDVAQTTQYYDGLGRQIQTVAMQQSPLQYDMVSINVYDDFGREQYKYLPYRASANDGNYKPSAIADIYNFNAGQYPGEQYYYSQTFFEPSPLNRVNLSAAPGMSWEGAGRGITSSYLINTAADSVRIWTIANTSGSIPTSTAIFAAGTLFENTTTDEAGHQVVEYKDIEGKTLLKKVQVAASPGTAHVGWLCTYYVYDVMNRLRFVIPPLTVQLINANWSITSGIASELCFRYEYDLRNRMVKKKIPGAGEAWMVYDIRNRLVMTQDSNLRINSFWIYSKYDNQNRPVSSGYLAATNDFTTISQNANADTSYPVLNGNYEELSHTYYDDYSWTAGTGLGSTMVTTGVTNMSNYFVTSYNTSPVYAVNPLPLYITRGLTTGTMKKVLGSTSQYLYTANFYDDRGRMVQNQSVNYTGGIDTATMQYDFTGRDIRSLLGHKKNGNTIQAHVVSTKMDYDHAGRLKHIYKNIDNAGADQLIDSMQYNELGQLKAKYLGNNIDSLVYDYNIRGWLTGINKNYVAGTTTHYFGMELGYDKTTSFAPGNTYTAAVFNGNIEGTVWKTAGSGINRKYDFTYDNVNRLTAANFTQYNGSTFDVSAGIDFTTNNLSYDANGNILTMNQKGFTVGRSSLIDQLTYTYQAGSNKLSQVADSVNNPTTLLGDFHYTGTKASYDYTYDGNGNLKIDNNKVIDNINYNFMNLPQLVHMNTKGNITYTYDGGGAKLQKTVVDSLGSKKTVTTYIGGFVYQNTSTLSGSGTDTLQFIAHEEGRARWAYHKYTTGTTAYKFEYDFFEKDHLGNTRMVLTQQTDTSNYLASMEAAYRTNEKQLFGNITNTAYARASVPGYPASTTITNPNDSVSKVDYNGTTGQKSGPSLLLKVMSGDAVSIAVQSYYNTNSITTTNSSFNDVLNSLANGIVTATSGSHGTVANFTASGSSVYSGLTNFLSANDPAPPAGYPKAYLNWVFLDDQFNYVSTSSGSIRAASTTYPAAALNAVAPGAPLNITKNGYLYIWVSNETQGWDVLFDNLSVQHRQGPVLEENHYYPFGLTMAGISDKAIKTNYAENKYRYNKGSELQNKEFSDGSGLEMYETSLRELDPQLGRWWQIDSKPTESESPYASMGNNPILRNDPLGDSGIAPNVARAAQSVAATTSATLVKSAQVRKEYVNTVSKLEKTDAAGRTAAKVAARENTPTVMNKIAEKMRPMSEEGSRIAGTASKTNPGVNTTVETLGNFGKLTGVAAVSVSVYNVATSDNKVQAVAQEGGALVGAVVGGELGAKAGAAIGALFGGVGAVPGAIIGAFIGSIAGGIIGHDAGKEAYNDVTK